MLIWHITYIVLILSIIFLEFKRRLLSFFINHSLWKQVKTNCYKATSHLISYYILK